MNDLENDELILEILNHKESSPFHTFCLGIFSKKIRYNGTISYSTLRTRHVNTQTLFRIRSWSTPTKPQCSILWDGGQHTSKLSGVVFSCRSYKSNLPGVCGENVMLSGLSSVKRGISMHSANALRSGESPLLCVCVFAWCVRRRFATDKGNEKMHNGRKCQQ